MAGALALMIEFREEVAVVLCMVVFACSAALVLVEIFAADLVQHLARPTGSLARREPLCEAPALSEVAACAPRRGDSPTKRTTTTTTTTTGPAVIQRRARASKPRARTALPTAGGPVMPRTAAGTRGSSAQSRSSPETVAATLLRLSSATAAFKASKLASIPEDKCICGVRMKCVCRKESPVSPWRACSDLKAAVTESLQSLRVECESLPVDDAVAHTFEDDASRNICNYRYTYESCGSSWSAAEDQNEDTSPGPSASSARPRSTRMPSLRVTLHASLSHAPAKKRGLAARASIELPEDGSPPQLHFRRNGVTAAFLVLDGESLAVSLITTLSPKAERGAAPNVSQWIKLSHVERTCDVYAYADLGWRTLLPHLYT